MVNSYKLGDHKIVYHGFSFFLGLPIVLKGFIAGVCCGSIAQNIMLRNGKA